VKENSNKSINELLTAYITGNTDSKTRMYVEELLDSSEAYRAEYEALKKAWKKSDSFRLPFQESDTAPALEKVHAKIKRRTKKQKQLRIGLLAAAASILLPMLIGIIWLQTNKPQYELALQAEKAAQTELSDGTVIQAAKNSSIYLASDYKTGNQRKVKLEGEAFFDVHENPEKPFIIETQNITVEVLGTSFNVESTAEITEVYVKKGKVKLKSPKKTGNYPEGMVLTKNEIGRYSPEAGLVKIPAKKSNANTIFRIDKKLYFENTGMDEVLSTVEKFYGISAKTENPDILKRKFTGSFDNDSIEHIIKVLAMSFELEYKKNNEAYFFYEADN
jgi:ferric-dicitrate binding protein FerR (iron transport regulator)